MSSRLVFGRFDAGSARISDADGNLIAVTSRYKHGTDFDVHSPDGVPLVSGRKPRKLGHKHDVLDAAGNRTAVVVSHGPIRQDVDLLDGRTWVLTGTLTDRTWSMRDDAGEVVVESTLLGTSKWALDWQVDCTAELDQALLIGVVATHHIIESNRPSQAQARLARCAGTWWPHMKSGCCPDVSGSPDGILLET